MRRSPSGLQCLHRDGSALGRGYRDGTMSCRWYARRPHLWYLDSECPKCHPETPCRFHGMSGCRPKAEEGLAVAVRPSCATSGLSPIIGAYFVLLYLDVLRHAVAEVLLLRSADGNPALRQPGNEL